MSSLIKWCKPDRKCWMKIWQLGPEAPSSSGHILRPPGPLWWMMVPLAGVFISVNLSRYIVDFQGGGSSSRMILCTEAVWTNVPCLFKKGRGSGAKPPKKKRHNSDKCTGRGIPKSTGCRFRTPYFHLLYRGSQSREEFLGLGPWVSVKCLQPGNHFIWSRASDLQYGFRLWSSPPLLHY